MTDIRHEKVATTPDDPDYEVGSDEWNAAHTVDIDAADVDFTPAGNLAATDVQGALEELDTEKSDTGHSHGASGAPADADYLVGTANGSLSAEIVVGTTPGGELGGTWASPTVDATHSGSTHSAATDTHIADTSAAHAASAVSADSTTLVGTGTDVQAVLEELDNGIADHLADTADAHDASAVSLADPAAAGYEADNVQGALNGQLSENVLNADHRNNDAGSSPFHSASGIAFTPNGSISSTNVQAAIQEVRDEAGGGGAPTDVDYLVGTASGGLSAEIVVGTTPGGELGGTWASPTVDATHSGSAHHTASHDHSSATDGTTLTPATLNLPATNTPAQTANGQAVWDSDGDFLTVGDGSGRQTFYPVVDATSDPAAVSTAAADGTEATTARKDHVHAHEAAHLTHDTLWAAAGDLVKGTGNDAADILARGSDDQFLRATSSTIAWESPPFSVGITLIGAAPANGNYMVWRAPFPCTLTNVRSHFKGGANCVVNARRNQTSNGLSSNFTNSTADAWGDGGSVQNTAYAAGDDLELMLVSTSGAVTEVCIQCDFTRP